MFISCSRVCWLAGPGLAGLGFICAWAQGCFTCLLSVCDLQLWEAVLMVTHERASPLCPFPVVQQTPISQSKKSKSRCGKQYFIYSDVASRAIDRYMLNLSQLFPQPGPPKDTLAVFRGHVLERARGQSTLPGPAGQGECWTAAQGPPVFT